MGDSLTTEQLIKIIIGIFVVVLVLFGVYFFFKDKVIDFLKGLFPSNPASIFMTLAK
jgi:hypothetical protein